MYFFFFDKLQLVKLFVMKRALPTCKLKGVCDEIQFSLTLASVENYVSIRQQ